MRRLGSLLALVLSLAACDTAARPPFTIEIVSPSGGDPIREIRSGTVTLEVRQLDMPILRRTAPIVGGVLEAVDVPITSYGIITRIAVTVEDDASDTEAPELVGASPPFVPLGYTFVRLVVGAPATCVLLAAPSLSSDRVGANLVAVESNLVSIGGEEVDGMASPHVEVLSPVQLTVAGEPVEFPSLARPISAGSALRLFETTQLLALSDVRGAVLYYLDPDRTIARDVDLAAAWDGNEVHPGAGPRSALVDLDVDGVAIIGGENGVAPARGITWVDVSGHATTTELRTPRIRPAAVRLFDRLLVAGGQAEGEPLFELVTITPIEERGAAFIETFGTGEPRFGAALVRDPAGSRAWLGFGEDAVEGGALVTTAMSIEGCPAACVASPALPIEQPRRGFAIVEREDETLVLGGEGADGLASRAVERVRFRGGVPMVEQLGELATARHRAGAAAIGQGVVVVAGGEVERGGGSSERRPLRDLEICFPESLEAL